MRQEFIHLGSVFKRTREEKNLSLKEVENATSIRLAFLEAIEEGNLGKLISPIYAQGFIKRYASFLELDGDALIQEHPYVMKILSEKKQESCSLGVNSLEVRGGSGWEMKWMPNLLWLGASIAFVLIAWFLARHFGIW